MQRLPASDFLRGRYPELIEEPGVPRWLNEFSFLVSYGAARANESPIIAYWGIYHEGGLTLANRLREDAAFRDEVASAAFGISGDDFARDARTRLARGVNRQTRTIYVPPGEGLLTSGAIDALPQPPTSEVPEG